MAKSTVLRGLPGPGHERRKLAKGRWIEDLEDHDIAIRHDDELGAGPETHGGRERQLVRGSKASARKPASG